MKYVIFCFFLILLSCDSKSKRNTILLNKIAQEKKNWKFLIKILPKYKRKIVLFGEGV